MKTKLILASTLFVCAIALADDHLVQQQDRKFSQKEITIKSGDSLTFTNCDSVTHNVFSISPSNPFTIKVQRPGAATSVTFTNEGDTEVRCAIHPGMKILVHVQK